MKRVLIAPLDWGLGHATRCIPVIRSLVRRNVEIHIAGSGASLDLLAREFPFIPTWKLPGYNPRYPSGSGMVGAMALQLPKFLSVIAREHKAVEELVQRHSIDIVISDNRFGCWTSLAHCVFLTHQSNIMMPAKFGWLSPLVRLMNERFISRFDACWIPDHPLDRSLAGALISFEKENIHPNVQYIGPLSRFSAAPDGGTPHYDVVAVCSGPEPQRTIFEKILTEQLPKSGSRYLLVRGVPENVNSYPPMKPRTVNFLTSDEMQKVLQSARIVVARSGFSTVMDLNVLGKKAIFVPTPGQTEQEYLAKRLMDKRITFAMKQQEFNLVRAIIESENYSGFSRAPQNKQLEKVLSDLLSDEGVSQ